MQWVWGGSWELVFPARPCDAGAAALGTRLWEPCAGLFPEGRDHIVVWPSLALVLCLHLVASRYLTTTAGWRSSSYLVPTMRSSPREERYRDYLVEFSQPRQGDTNPIPMSQREPWSPGELR